MSDQQPDTVNELADFIDVVIIGWERRAPLPPVMARRVLAWVEERYVLRGEHEQVVAQLNALQSWEGMLRLLDEYWPADVFGNGMSGTGEGHDPGVRIINLIRALERVRADAVPRQDVLDLAADLDKNTPGGSHPASLWLRALLAGGTD